MRLSCTTSRPRGPILVAVVLVTLAATSYLAAQGPPSPAPPLGQPPTPMPPGGPPGQPTPPGGQPGQPPGPTPPSQPEGPIAVFVPEKPDGQKLISMSFDQADIDHVLRFLAEQSGKTIVKDPAVQAKVTIASTAKVTVADAFRILSALLSVKGYVMIDGDDLVRVVPRKTALQAPTGVTVGPEPLEGADEYVTRVLQIEHIDATKLKEDLKPLVPEEQGVLIANADTNTLVVIDSAARANRLVEIVKQLDTDRAEAKDIEVITLEFADAEELAQELTEVFQREGALAGLSADARRRMMEGGGGMPGGGPPGQQPPGAPATKGLLDERGEVKIVAEKRTNALIVSASEGNLEAIRDIVKKVDVDMSPEVTAKIVPLKFADAETLANQVNQLFEDTDSFSRRGGSPFGRMFGFFGGSGGGRQTTDTQGMAANRVVPDVRTNSLVITAEEDNLQQVLEVVKQLDITSEVKQVVKAIPLENAVATTVADTLNNLIRGGRRGGFFSFMLMGSQQNRGGQAPLDQLQNVNIVADSPTNTIILSGPKDTFDTLEQLIKQLDRRIPQVYIEVLIADVTLDKSNRLGVEWSLIDRSLFGHSSATGTLGQTFEGLKQVASGFSYNLISNSVQAFLHTLEERSNVEILSSPNIMASDNTPATISIGESIPYQASSQQTTTGGLLQTVDFIEVSNKLIVTPHVNQRQRISLEVNQTVDALLSFDQRLLAPRIAKRNAETTIEVSDGQTIIIGGIISKQRTVTINGIPILRKIPIIGPLFEDKERRETRSELLVFLTPHIIMGDEQVDALTKTGGDRMSVNPLEDPDLHPLEIPPAPEGSLSQPGTPETLQEPAAPPAP